VPVERIVNNPPSPAGDVSPRNPGTWQFFKQGFAVGTGVQISSEGDITTAGTLTAGAVVGPITGPVAVTGATAATDAITTKVTGDTQPRFTIDSDGTLLWGSGSGAADVSLFRYAPDGLSTDDAFKIGAAAMLLLGAAGDVNLYRNAGGNLTTDDSFVLAAAGTGIQIKEGGAAARSGTATLVAGTVTVNTTGVTANSRIYLTAQTSGAAPGALRISARVAGTSFTITSTSGTDTSLVAWLIVEPAP